jgi:hypothetical protein
LKRDITQQRIADSRQQQTANSRRQTADSRRQIADDRREMADGVLPSLAMPSEAEERVEEPRPTNETLEERKCVGYCSIVFLLLYR